MGEDHFQIVIFNTLHKNFSGSTNRTVCSVVIMNVVRCCIMRYKNLSQRVDHSESHSLDSSRPRNATSVSGAVVL